EKLKKEVKVLLFLMFGVTTPSANSKTKGTTRCTV
ncbi:MAG: hypothetical protein, partial [Olavius algarvensis Gamma 3 endosymbiont]